MRTKATVFKRKTKFHSKGPAASSVIQRDLDVIRYLVEKELKISVKSKRRSQRHVDAKRIFIALILYTYNRNLGKLKSPYVVTLSSLARYLGYKSHASISLHMVNRASWSWMQTYPGFNRHPKAHWWAKGGWSPWWALTLGG